MARAGELQIERKLSPGRRLRKAVRHMAASLGYHSKPAFIIIGAQKAGTTGLFAMLSKHPQLKHPSDKELHYFDGAKIPYGDRNAYHSHFPLPFALSPDKVTYEATPSYLYHPECAKRIHAYAPEMKLIAILREPVSRAYSSWNMYRSFLESDNAYYRSVSDARSFEQAIDDELQLIGKGSDDRGKGYIARGFYAEQLERYYGCFPSDQLKVLDYRDLRDEPQKVIGEVCDFIGIDAKVKLPVMEANKSTYNSRLENGIIEKLQPVFKPMNERLYTLIDRDLGW